MSDFAETQCITVPEAAFQCKVSGTSVRAWIKGGKLPASRSDSHLYLIRQRDLNSFMRRNRLPILVALFLAVGAGAGLGEDAFRFTFDEEPGDRGNPEGFNVYGDLAEERGVTMESYVSEPQSAYVVADFAKTEWGTILLSQPDSWDLTDARLTVLIRADRDLPVGDTGFIGFKLIDALGREFRTKNADLVTPGAEWKIMSQKIWDINFAEVDGGAELDPSQIIQVGILIYDPSESVSTEKVKFFIDDFRATSFGKKLAIR